LPGFVLTFSRSLRLSLIARQAADQRLASSTKSTPQSATSVNPLLEEHLDAAFRYALRLTKNRTQAEDLTQETMLRAWRKRAALREHQAAKVWLLRIATNLWTDQLRKKIEQPRLLVNPPTDPQLTTAKKLIQQESVAAALAALDELPDRQRQVMHLITVEQLGQQQTAEILGISPAAVKASLSMARKHLREQLKDLYEEFCGAKR
jgi:RNA polymerase sigma-70 factor (ECF subfamily)